MPYLGAAGTPVTNLAGTETVVFDNAGSLIEITAANLGASAPLVQAMADFLGAHVAAGTNVTFTRVGNSFTITAPGAAYTANQMMDDLSTRVIAGANMTVTYDATAHTITLAATAVASYTDTQARAAIGAAATGDPGHLIVTPNVGAGTINWSLDPNFVAQVTALGPGTFIQTNDSVVATASYASTPGTSGNYVSSPSSGAANILGDIDVSAYIAPTLWSVAGGQVFFSKLANTTSNGTYRFGLNATGQLQIGTNIDGVVTSFVATTISPGGVDGVGMWVRYTRASVTGNCSFYTAPGLPPETEPTAGQWVTLQLNRPGTAGSALTSTAALCVSGINNGTGVPFAGKVYRVIVRNGIAGTIAVDFNPSSWTTGSTWTSATGEVWTLNGTAAVTAGSSTAVSNTTAQFSVGETDPQASIPLALHDTMFFFSSFGLVNTSGSSATFTFKVTINGADLFLIPVQTLTSVASSVRNGYLELRVDMNGSSGSAQVASATFVIANATTGTGSGSDTLATEFVRVTGGRAVSALTTFNSVPQIQLRCTMGTAATTISAQRQLTQLVLGKA